MYYQKLMGIREDMSGPQLKPAILEAEAQSESDSDEEGDGTTRGANGATADTEEGEGREVEGPADERLDNKVRSADSYTLASWQHLLTHEWAE